MYKNGYLVDYKEEKWVENNEKRTWVSDIIHTRPDINRYQRMLIHRIRITIQSLIYEIYFKYISNSNTQLLSLSILPIGSSYQSNQLHCIVSIILYFYTLYAILYSITFTGMWQLVSLPANLATSPLLPCLP